MRTRTAVRAPAERLGALRDRARREGRGGRAVVLNREQDVAVLRLQRDDRARRLRVLPDVAQPLVHHLDQLGGQAVRDADAPAYVEPHINTIVLLKLLSV